MDLTTLDLKELGLSMGFRKIIEGIISQLKRIPRISTDGLIGIIQSLQCMQSMTQRNYNLYTFRR